VRSLRGCGIYRIVGLEQKLSLKLSQRLVMTPTLQQAIKLLQMTRFELQDVVNQEIVTNPVLEEEEGSSEESSLNTAGAESGPTEQATSAETGAGEDGGSGTSENSQDSQESAPATAGAVDREGEAGSPGEAQENPPDKLFEEIDFEAFFGDYLDGGSTAPRMTEELDEFSLENRAETPPGLADHLTEQLSLSEASPDVREACIFLIGNVDPDGYLRMTEEEIVEGVPCSMEVAQKAILLLQSFDPTGVGGKDLADCLLLQLRAIHEDSPLLVELVTTRFHDLGTKPFPLIARQMNVPMEELQKAIDVIRRLDPKPGRRYDSSRTIYVEPDVAVVKIEDDYVVQFNDDGLPRLKVSSLYRRMLSADDGALDGDGKSYLREKIRAAQWLMKSLDQRKRTIVRVAESIVKKQRDFFDYGVAHLRPLVLRDVAEDIGMHESTVSRVVSNKWMATPRGLIPMKFFFHSAIASSGGEDVSSLAVKGKIKSLVDAEDPEKPLSDARLSELLAREGIKIARRTVAKYREELHIPSSSIRKTEPAPAPEKVTGALGAPTEERE
jgi:RNA polymerase sigma-54 factor